MAKAPELRLEPKIMQYGDCVCLDAIVEAHPIPTVRWLKDGAPISVDPQIDPRYLIKMETMNVENTYRVIAEILEFNRSMAGIYKCEIENERGKTTAIFTVSAGDPPEFIDKPHIIQRDKGKVLAIKVRVKSNNGTPLDMKWTKDDQPIVENDRIKSISKQGDANGEYWYLLEIKGPCKEDEATYKCKVNNSGGSSSQSLALSFDD